MFRCSHLSFSFYVTLSLGAVSVVHACCGTCLCFKVSCRSYTHAVVRVRVSRSSVGCTHMLWYVFVLQGLAYDEIMLRHACVCRNDANHPENPSRLLCIYSRFLETGLHNKCEVQ